MNLLLRRPGLRILSVIMAHKLLVVFLSALALVPTAQSHETLKRSTLEKRACKSYLHIVYRVEIISSAIPNPPTHHLLPIPLTTPTPTTSNPPSIHPTNHPIPGDPGETLCGTTGTIQFCAPVGYKCCSKEKSAPLAATCCPSGGYAEPGYYCCAEAGFVCRVGRTCRGCTPAGSNGFSIPPIPSISIPPPPTLPSLSIPVLSLPPVVTTRAVVQRYTFTVT